MESYADDRVRVEDFKDPLDLALHVCKVARLEGCKRPAAASSPEWLSSVLGGSVRGHHREHGSCSMRQVREADPKLANAIVALAAHYGYSDGPACNLSL